MESYIRGKKRYYRDAPSMLDPNIKCPIHGREIRHELEERIRETEDGMDLAALVQAWCQITKEDAIERQMPPDVQMSTAIKEVMVNIFMFILGAVAVIGFLMLSARL